jgi:hypothetical protein
MTFTSKYSPDQGLSSDGKIIFGISIFEEYESMND